MNKNIRKGFLNMRKLICFILTAALVITPATTAFAKSHNHNHNDQQEQEQEQEHQNVRIQEQKQSFKIGGASVIKYGRYKIPLSPITKGMGAKVTFDKATGVLTIVKDTKTIVIDFKNKTVTVNGVADTASGIFTAKNSKKMTVLIKYVANVLGVRVNVGDDKITVTVPGLDFPTNVAIAPIGGTVVANTLNSTNVALTATAAIKAGQAVKAELYVGDKLVATDSAIAATDTSVSFITGDDTPTAAELQALIATGGVVTVRLYNSSNAYVISKAANPTLKVDYTAPTVTGAVVAAYAVSGSAITITVTGASITADKVDVTKISLYDTTLAKTYQLTNTAVTGSTGVVADANTLVITLGSVDMTGLAGFGTTTMFLNIAPGSLLYDAAGNVSLPGAAQTIAVNVLR
jgi:hypothetical protein